MQIAILTIAIFNLLGNLIIMFMILGTVGVIRKRTDKIMMEVDDGK